MSPLFAVGLVFLGCCSNVIFLELLVTEIPSSGNIVTFVQFMFITLEGFIFTIDFGRRKTIIPVSSYATMVTLYFLVSVINNYAINFNITMPLHMIFRSNLLCLVNAFYGSLIANLILGVFILKKSYTATKYLSVVMITIGIGLATIATAQQKGDQPDLSEEARVSEMIRWLIGIAMLTFALLTSARMGIYQETVYRKFGKHPSEALFYNHALPLPVFLFLSKDIYNHVILFNQSAPMALPLLGIEIPKMWIYLLGNTITQYVCIRGVFILTTECSSLTVTLIVTLRKFVSLLFSIVYFDNAFTPAHWLGTAFVFGGTLLFTESFSYARRALAGVTRARKTQ